MSTIEEHLDALLTDCGVELVETGKLDPRFNACFHAASRTIFVRRGLDPVTRTCAIAHELGHAWHNDDCSTPRAERLADEWAATHLITGTTIKELARDCSGVPGAMAAELGVTPHLLEVWVGLYSAGKISLDGEMFPSCEKRNFWGYDERTFDDERGYGARDGAGTD